MGVLDYPNFWLFCRCQHFHCITIEKSNQCGMNRHKIQEIEHIPGVHIYTKADLMNIPNRYILEKRFTSVLYAKKYL